MYKVYIVDDEPMNIKSLVKAVKWQEHGFEIIGSHEDSSIALNEIISLKPDLVFVDLKMPILNGIELIKACNDNAVESEFIMLSAFAEFDASREFFLNGGLDYLLKPANKLDLGMVLDRVSCKLSQKNSVETQKNVIKYSESAFDKLLEYVEKNYSRKLSLNSLSNKFYISETYICELFGKNLGKTFRVYITDLRMKKASELITKTDKSMKEIGIDCGYSDYFYFCRVFKNHFGISPNEYRKENLKNDEN